MERLIVAKPYIQRFYDVKPRHIFHDPEPNPFGSWYCPPLPKFHFSATAVAIAFLRSVPPATRSQIRTVIIREDHHSECMPLCHAQGLISICQENSLLRVERHVAYQVWALGGCQFDLSCNKGRLLFADRHALLAARRTDRNHDDKRRAGLVRNGDRYRYSLDVNYTDVIERCAAWIESVAKLAALGMPFNQFEMVFDGSDEILEQAWNWLRETAILVSALRTRFPSEPPPSTRRQIWNTIDKLPEAFPSTIRAIVEERLRVSFGKGLDLDWPWNTQGVAEQHKN